MEADLDRERLELTLDVLDAGMSVLGDVGAQLGGADALSWLATISDRLGRAGRLAADEATAATPAQAPSRPRHGAAYAAFVLGAATAALQAIEALSAGAASGSHEFRSGLVGELRQRCASHAALDPDARLCELHARAVSALGSLARTLDSRAERSGPDRLEPFLGFAVVAVRVAAAARPSAPEPIG